ncbi:hypothetical protein EB796_025202 [Bugula neritina]|uniref:Uncharacterized protein n=1 Tax=Bugula neritina TaxID=10212 RepID=A0A7J7IRB5_BUGNE|nr:hypothetical protein EB796_025202 [Bugula neritina]
MLDFYFEFKPCRGTWIKRNLLDTKNTFYRNFLDSNDEEIKIKTMTHIPSELPEFISNSSDYILQEVIYILQEVTSAVASLN